MCGEKTPIYIQDDVISEFEQDTFGHKHIAAAVLDSILTTKPPFTIGIFGGWGSGKSSLLELISRNLKKENVVTVTIDAWRYSSADNLRRAFLVHVANELAPDQLEELRLLLFTSEQETLDLKSSKLGNSQNHIWERLKDFLLSALLWSAVFLVLIFLYFSMRTLIYHGFSGFLENFDKGFIDKFIDLGLFPILLSIINNLRLQFIHRPVTITQERIDADELFAEYFEIVVDQALIKNFVDKTLKLKSSKNKLVIFIDNLDRLTDDKMVEALESLKTYLDNKKCVFIVACDDNVVRSVINKSNKIPKNSESSSTDENNNTDGKAGEHYLDKFFQQTFRLPEYMSINLTDFALMNFETTQLYKDLQARKFDIPNLVSIILPSNVSSPRKVKRLLNEFIALYEIVKRRENEKDGQLKPRRLTGNIEFLAKLSTIRAEYPVFYKDLVEDRTLMKKVTDLFATADKEQKQLSECNTKYSEACIAYLRKTQTILVDDLDPYIWLSQDTLALHLKGSHYDSLRTALANGDIDQVEFLINQSESTQYKENIARVAWRTVEQRLIGIDQRNGVKVLSHLIPSVDDQIKSGIAHVIVKLLPSCAIDDFSTVELINVLRWAREAGIYTQYERLLSCILGRLNNVQSRQSSFHAILQNADVIEKYQATERVKEWLADILTDKNQSAPSDSETTSEETDTVDQNAKNRQFAEWLIGQVEQYSMNRFVIQHYLSTDLVDYMIRRLFGDYENVEAVYWDETEGVIIDIQIALNVISTEIMNGLESINYWNGLSRLLHDSPCIPEINYSLVKINQLIDFCPVNLVEKLVSNTFRAIRHGIEEPDNDECSSELITVIKQAKEVVFALRNHKNELFDRNQLEQLEENIANILNETEYCKELIILFDSYFEQFNTDEDAVFIEGIVKGLEENIEKEEIVNMLIDLLIKWNCYVSPAKKSVIVEKINQLFLTNQLNFINATCGYLSKLVYIEDYQKMIKNYEVKWLKKIGADEPRLLKSKVDLFTSLINSDVFSADSFVESIIPHIPYSGNINQLQIVIEAIETIRKKVSEETGIKLFISTMTHIGKMSSLIPNGLRLISLWVDCVGEPHRTQFNEILYRTFPTAPVQIMEVLSSSWQALGETEIKNHIVQLYSHQFEYKTQLKRNECAVMGLNNIVEDNRSDIIHSVWNELVDHGKQAEQFMDTAVRSISLGILLKLRQDAIEIVRENGASELSEASLRLLSIAYRKDMRDTMPIVDLFVNLFGRGQQDIQMAHKHVVKCLEPLNIRNTHKHRLAEAMGQAAKRIEDRNINQELHKKADQLGLKWGPYRKYWK